ncbi:ADP-ribose glycohydrolase MACROD2 [Penicillium longicatenatum]|uniref:ADP-ribose glycohydrolase MACROD2 n=1 Tax=Penicillium longicatenatum TaxID=1561947 RepID=UPI0025482CC2|nr:ADP-ribose glycohydrolase MACROD2 [Penicillium longicatenatum]KAJ5639152.1 ADP-ribose glycohydrolase MACROD2 [Penicillium longicatenatum]
MANSLLTLAEIPVLSQLYRSGLLSKPAPLRTEDSTQSDNGSGATKLTPRQPVQSLNNMVSYLQADITKLKVDGIVNAANRALEGGSGVNGVIQRVAGPQLLQDCLKLGGCETGDAKCTLAYDLPCERVIHTVGPVYGMEYRMDPRRPEALLRSCYRRCLEVAVDRGVRSIAFSCISTGIYGYPNREAAIAAADEVRNFLETSQDAPKIDRVIFCLFQDVDVRIYKQVLPLVFPPTDDDLKELNDDA